MFNFHRQRTVQHVLTAGSEKFLTHLDKSLDEFGPSVKPVVYFKFHEDYGLRREDICDRPDLFVKTIDSMFGEGSSFVKSHIENEMRAVSAPFELGQSSTEDILKKTLSFLSSALR